MIQTKIQEELSIHLFSALAARAGYTAIPPRIDEGTDLLLYRSEKLPSRNNFISVGRWLTIQLKCTTEKQVSEQGDFLCYDIRAKNHDDLVFRKKSWDSHSGDLVPHILALLVLSDDTASWLQADFTKKNYSINGVFYWYLPRTEQNYSKNPNKQRIYIPLKNKVDLDFFDFIYNLFFKTNKA